MKFMRSKAITSESTFEQAIIWFYSFLCYAFLTACRQCLPVAKPFLLGTLRIIDGKEEVIGGYAPFNDSKTGSTYLGILDSAFVLTYTVCSFIWAHKRFAPLLMQINLLVLALVGSAGCLLLFGLAHSMDLHSFPYFVAIQLLLGFFQSGAWSAVLNIYYSAFDIEKGVLLFTAWASNSAVGNILGRTIASSIGSSFGWPAGFYAVAGSVLILGITNRLTYRYILNAGARKLNEREILKKQQDELSRILEVSSRVGENTSSAGAESSSRYRESAFELVNPSLLPSSENDYVDLGPTVNSTSESLSANDGGDSDVMGLQMTLEDDASMIQDESVEDILSLPSAVKIENNSACIAPTTSNSAMILLIFLYSLGLMFSKWMNYLMSLWLPVYLTAKGNFSQGAAGVWSSAFDIGACVGIFIAFVLNFRFKKPGCVCFVMCFLSAIFLVVYSETVAYIPVLGNAFLLFVLGILFNGPYTLISTVVTMQLSEQFGQNANAIISIVNGSGSAGSLFAGVFTAMVSSAYGWDAVLYMLIALAVLQLLPLGYISSIEFRSKPEISENFKEYSTDVSDAGGGTGGSRVRSMSSIESNSDRYSQPSTHSTSGVSRHDSHVIVTDDVLGGINVTARNSIPLGGSSPAVRKLGRQQSGSVPTPTTTRVYSPLPAEELDER